MIYLGKYKILNNFVDACDYDFVLAKIIESKKKDKHILITPIATDALVYSYFHPNFTKILNHYNYLLPDSQWIKISIGFLYRKWLDKRVTGTELMLKICGLVQEEKLKIYCYGCTDKILQRLKRNLTKIYPNIMISGIMPANYSRLDEDCINLAKNIQVTRPNIIFISLGGVRQIEFSLNLFRSITGDFLPALIIPVGAAFDYISGNKPRAPLWMQNFGLEWLFRLGLEPLRLWKRYLIFGPIFILKIIWQKVENRINGV